MTLRPPPPRITLSTASPPPRTSPIPLRPPGPPRPPIHHPWATPRSIWMPSDPPSTPLNPLYTPWDPHRVIITSSPSPFPSTHLHDTNAPHSSHGPAPRTRAHAPPRAPSPRALTLTAEDVGALRGRGAEGAAQLRPPAPTPGAPPGRPHRAPPSHRAQHAARQPPPFALRPLPLAPPSRPAPPRFASPLAFFPHILFWPNSQ